MDNYILELIKNDGIDNSPIMIDLSKKTVDNLLPFQILPTQVIISNLKNRAVCINASDTGTGKTYTSMAAAKELKKNPLIICKQAVIPIWAKIADKFGVKPLAIVNYETIKKGKMYNKEGKRIKCPYLDYDQSEKKFKWKLPNNTLIIFDEVHNCKEKKTINAKLLASTVGIYNKKNPLLMLSATICDKLENFKIIAYVLGFIKNLSHATGWMKYMNKNPTLTMKKLHNELFPKYASRITISELKDVFPESQVSADEYLMNNYQEIEDAYIELENAINELKNKENNDSDFILVKILRARQKIELLKIPTFVEQAKDYLENNNSVVIFVNFKETMYTLAKLLNTNCLIHGDQKKEVRQKNIDAFQNNSERIIICNMHAGGESISLHDIHGGHPRVSLISPTWSALRLIQVLGRIYRVGSKTPVLQRIICCAKTIESSVCVNLNIKINNISQINDGDLLTDTYKIDNFEELVKKIEKEIKESKNKFYI
jgi:superfamily II DNA or RNA helicase